PFWLNIGSFEKGPMQRPTAAPRPSFENAWPRTTRAGFVVNCEGHVDVGSHTEYRFRVRHSGGCEWTIKRRYTELYDLHERLMAVFGAGRLPDFPPKTPLSAGTIGRLFGQPTGSRPEVVAQRRVDFQKYFDRLCDNQEVTRTACFQKALGVTTPAPVSGLRVVRWSSTNEKEGLVAELEIWPAGAAGVEAGRLAETYHVVASLVFQDRSSGQEELGPVADEEVPAGATSVPVEGLKPSAEVELTVCAVNAVARSVPVSRRLRVPQSAQSPSAATSPALGPASRLPAGSPEALQLETARQMEQFRSQREGLAELEQMPTASFSEPMPAGTFSEHLPSETFSDASGLRAGESPPLGTFSDAGALLAGESPLAEAESDAGGSPERELKSPGRSWGGSSHFLPSPDGTPEPSPLPSPRLSAADEESSSGARRTSTGSGQSSGRPRARWSAAPRRPPASPGRRSPSRRCWSGGCGS
ncbi:unnamed protein product, partial [Prorocentrum cordatum]